MSKPDGGPAFPRHETEHHRTGDVEKTHRYFHGMSLRDYFAGQALNGLLAQNYAGFVDVTVEGAYELADAMLAEREKE